jgi:hypothetical protein
MMGVSREDRVGVAHARGFRSSSRETPALEHKSVCASLPINGDFLILRRTMKFERRDLIRKFENYDLIGPVLAV